VGIVPLLSLDVFENRGELLEAVGPQALVPLHPVVDRLERSPVQPVQPSAAVLADVHGTDLAQDAEVLGYLRLRETELADEVVDGLLAVGEHVENLAPARLGYRVERIGRRRRSCHVLNIYRYRYMSSRYDRSVDRAVHDRGGWPDETPIDRSEHELADWEVLMDAVENALEDRRVMNTDEMRRGIESMPLTEYEGASYYERWLYATERILEEKGVLAAGELDARVAP
jgi:Nitrile hydratase beta subunit, N-terminal